MKRYLIFSLQHDTFLGSGRGYFGRIERCKCKKNANKESGELVELGSQRKGHREGQSCGGRLECEEDITFQVYRQAVEAKKTTTHTRITRIFQGPLAMTTRSQIFGTFEGRVWDRVTCNRPQLSWWSVRHQNDYGLPGKKGISSCSPQGNSRKSIVSGGWEIKDY